MQKNLGIYIAGRVLEVSYFTSKSGKAYFRVVLYVGGSRTVTVMSDATQPKPCSVDDLVVFEVSPSGSPLFFLNPTLNQQEGGDLE